MSTDDSDVRSTAHRSPDWWRDAVVYQVYPRSFMDSDGDGIGDLNGLLSRLDYLQSLSVDAIWITPCYPSPLLDGGYDVADYRNIDPRLGDLATIDAIIAQAHERGIKVLMDLVPNHSSWDHAWFKAALKTAPGSPEWDRYMVRYGKGDNGELPPNNWRSVFHGCGWSHVKDDEGNPTGYWYLHIFDSSQPDLNWQNPEVRQEFLDILRFWFDRGLDGFRIDVAHGMIKQDGLPDMDYSNVDTELLGDIPESPHWDQPGVHEIYREWRKVANEYEPVRVFAGEAWVRTPEALARYLRPDELHTSFNFEYLSTPWDPARLRKVIDTSLKYDREVGAATTWVLSNHDVHRHVSRFAPVDTNGNRDLVEGLSRAKAASLFMLALPGTAYLYQGEELGLPEVFDLPDDVRQDPVFFRTSGEVLGRDGCRVPLPWEADAAAFGFSPTGESWLPQPLNWVNLAADAQEGDPLSTLTMYQQALDVRRHHPALGEGPDEWLDAPDKVLALRRFTEDGSSLVAVINMGDSVVTLPYGDQVILASDPLAVTILDGQVNLPASTCVWIDA